MQRKSALDDAGVPAPLLQTAPRDVRVNTSGGLMYLAAAALVVAGMWGGIVLGRRAEVANRRLGLFASERIVTAGDIVRLQKRGGGNDHRIIAHYRYTAHGRELVGQTTLRRAERERYAVGSPVAVWYLPSEPEQNWMDGYAPRGEPGWPAAAVPLACGIAALVLIQLVRRQSALLAYGRPAMATVTKVEKKRTDKGTFWMVHYEFTTLTGATRAGKYPHGRKQVPAIGERLPIVYDRDNSYRHRKYPMGLVKVKSKK